MEIFSFLLIWLSIEGATVPPPPTPEIKKMIVGLDSDEWPVREKASSDLRKEGYKALRACMDAKKNSPSLEVRRRCERLVNCYFNVTSNDKETWMPSIWWLDNDERFPHGFKYEADTDEPDPMKNAYLGGRGWCKELTTTFDLSAYYYAKARVKYNEYAEKHRFQKVEDDCWLDEEVSREAMIMYVHDRLYYGVTQKEMTKVLDKAVKRMSTHTHLHRHYPVDGAYRQKGCVPPGPLIRSEEVPQQAEWRFSS